jgi:hypothetical protein
MSSFADAVGLAPDQNLDDAFVHGFNGRFTGPQVSNDKVLRDAIAMDLGKLVCFVSRGIAVADRRDLADFEATVFEHALQILPRYFRQAFKKQIPAFDWFRKAINRKFWELTRRDLMIRRRSQSIEGMDESSAGADEIDKMAIVRSGKKQRSFRLENADDTHRAARLIDHKISKLVRAFSMTTDEHEQHVYRSNVLALQDIRFELIGSFKRVLTEGVEYTRRRRNHHLPTPPRRRGPVKPTRVEHQIIMKSEIPLWTLPA